MSSRPSVTALSEAKRICNFYRKARKLKKGSAAARRYMSACVLKIAARREHIRARVRKIARKKRR